MDFTGMFLGYKKNRPLTDEERDLQLKQKEHLDIEPGHDQCVIRMNSTYLESVDRYYAWRGVIFTFAFVIVLGVVALLGASFSVAFSRWSSEHHRNDVIGLYIFSAMFFPVILIHIWIILKESFTYTHFPIRLNRKNRKVYVFRPGRPNKPILIADWDTLFFTLGRCNRGAADFVQNWDIRAHVLSEDRNTVLDTFSFSVDSTDQDELRSHWEFLRRYMEDGPQDAYKRVEVCMPLNGQREAFKVGLSRFLGNFKGVPLLMGILFSPLILLAVPARWLAQQTDRIPVWPESIELECQIEPNDPYAKDASTNPSDSWLW
jgi:hypothetical protein